MVNSGKGKDIDDFVNDVSDYVQEAEDGIEINVPAEFRNVSPRYYDLSVMEMWQMYVKGQLILQPDFQRDFVWDAARASKLIESVILKMPIPPIYLAENNDVTYDIIDGHQRIESIFRFLQPLSSGPSEGFRPSPLQVLKLSNLAVLGNLNGQIVTALTKDEREKLWNSHLSIVSIPPGTNSHLKYELFARLNLGTMPLTPQELRNCLYRGTYNNLIKEIGGRNEVLKFFGKKEADKRMKDCEHVLTFFTLVHRFDKPISPFRLWLNQEMEEHQNLAPEDAKNLRGEFFEAMTLVREVFGEQSCRRFRAGSDKDTGGRWGNRHDLVRDVQMVCLFKAKQGLDDVRRDMNSDTERQIFLRGLRHALVTKMVREDFANTLQEGTKRPENIKQRHGLFQQAINWAIDNPDKVISHQRSLSEALHTNPSCVKCKGMLNSEDDADLILYSGKYVVAHRYCSILHSLPKLSF